MGSNLRLVVLISVFIIVAVLVWNVLESGDEAVAPEPGQRIPSTRRPQPTTDAFLPRPDTTRKPQQENIAVRLDTGPTGAITGAKVRIKLEDTGVGIIRGLVKNENDDAVAGANIKLERADWKLHETPGEDVFWRHANSDAEGRFEFARLPFARYAIMAYSTDGFDVESAYLSDYRNERELTLKLRPSGIIAGTVWNTVGEPVTDALLYPEKQENPDKRMRASYKAPMRARTDENGKYRFEHLWFGRWQFAVKAPGYATLLTDYVGVGDQSADFVLTKGGAVSGRVVRADTGGPVADVQLLIPGVTNLDRYELTSDGRGEFQAGNLAEGEYQVVVVDEIMAQAGEPAKFAITGDREVTGLRVRVAEGGIITGRVYDADTNRGIAGARVVARSESEGFGPKEAQTDRDGNYRLEGLGEAPYHVHCEDPEGYPRPDRHATKLVSARLGQEIQDIDFAFAKGLKVAGKVVDTTGRPVNNAYVTARTPHGGMRKYTRSKNNGAFVVAGLKPTGDLYLGASKEGLATKRVGPLTLTDEGLDNIEITLDVEASISGKVVDRSNRPVAKAKVMARRTSRDPRMGSSGHETDEQGKFRIDGLSAGAYELMATRSAHFDNKAQIEIEVEAGEEVTGVTLVIDEAEGLPIAGRVIDTAGKPIHRAMVDAASHGQHYEQGYARTDKDGYYRIADLAEGTYQVNVSHDDYSSARRRDVTAGDERVDFTLEGRGAIEGLVLRADTGQPITEFEIMQRKGIEQQLDPQMNWRFLKIHDAEGRFRLTRVEAGKATVIARAPRFAPGFKIVQGVTADETVSGVVIRLEPGAAVEGIVMNTAGQPVAGADIFIGRVPHEGERERGGETQTGPDGMFRLDALSSTTRLIAACHPDYAPASVEVLPDPARIVQVEIVLTQGGIVQGRVTVAGQPVGGHYVNVSFFRQSGGSYSGAETRADGTYHIAGLAVGEALVSVHLSAEQRGLYGSRQIIRQVTIEEGLASIVDFDLATADAAIEGTIVIQGQPPGTAWVNLSEANATGTGEHFSTQADASGYYRIDGVPAGEFQLRVSAQSPDGAHQVRTVTVETASGRVSRRDINFSEGSAIVGQVLGFSSGGQGGVTALPGEVAIPELTMETFQGLFRQAAGVASIRNDGTFRLEGLEAGTYTLFVIAIAGTGQLSGPEEAFANMRHATAVVSLPENGELAVNLTLH